MDLDAAGEQRRDQRGQRRAVALDRGFEFQALAGGHYRDAVTAEVAAENDRVAGLDAARRNRQIVLDDADAGRVDKDLVAFSAVDHLCVAGDEMYAGRVGRLPHRLDDPPQFFGRHALLR